MIFVSRKILQSYLFLGMICIGGCSSSSTTAIENNSIIGHWFHGCAQLDSISFPKTGFNLGGFGIYELEFTEDSFEAIIHLYDDNNCRDWSNDITMAGDYRILKAMDGTEPGTLSATVTSSDLMVNWEEQINYKRQDSRLYFSHLFSTDATVDIGFAYLRILE